MKRTFFAAFTIACTMGLSSKGDEPPPAGKSALHEAKEKFLQAETRVGFVLRDAIVEGFLNSSDAPDDQRRALREKLRPAVEESFDARQRMQAAELDGLRRRLAEIEQAVAAREKIKDAIVNARIDSLLIGLNGVGAKTMQSLQDNELKTKTVGEPLNDPNLGAESPPGTVVVPFTTAVPARFAGEVLRIGQKSDEDDGQGVNRQRPLAVGDNVAANELLAVIGEKRADGKAWSGREIRAPHVGVVAEKNVDVGDVVRPGDVLFQVRQIVVHPSAGEPETGINVSPRTVPFVPDSAGRGADSTDGFDLETREQLAQIDVQEAQADIDAADKQVMFARKLYESARAPYSALAAAEKDVRRAKAELDRAKVKVEGVKRQREAAAKEAVAGAEGLRNIAVGMVRAKEGNRNEAEARLQKAEAELKAAMAKRDYEVKQLERVQKLVDTGAADANLLGEHKNNLSAAEADLSAATSAVKSAKAYLNDNERQVEEARAAVSVSEAKLREAQAQLDLLLRRSAPKPPAVVAPKTVEETQP